MTSWPASSAFVIEFLTQDTSDSGDPNHTSHSGVPGTAFRQQNGVGITIRPISELIPHGLLTRCVRFASAGRPTNGNTRYRPARYGFDRAGLAPAGLQQEVSLTHHSSPSSALIPARSASGRGCVETYSQGRCGAVGGAGVLAGLRVLFDNWTIRTVRRYRSPLGELRSRDGSLWWPKKELCALKHHDSNQLFQA